MTRSRLGNAARLKLAFGSVRLPVWIFAVVTIAIIGAAAGQAVGPVLSGGVQGSTGITLGDGIIVDPQPGANDVIWLGGHADDFLVTVNDEGTAFTAAIEMHVGDTAFLRLDIDNLTDASANAVFEMNIPRGIDVELEESATSRGIEEAQLTRNSWLMRLSTSTAGTLNVAISSKDDLQPGFYTLTGRLVQVAN